VDPAEEDGNSERKSAMVAGRRVVVELDHNVRNESSLEVVVGQVAWVAEVASQEAERKGFGATMRSMPFGDALLGEVGADCCTATDWIAEVLVIRSCACHGPNVNSRGPEIPFELLKDTMERH
jgi:hypothetical protein